MNSKIKIVKIFLNHTGLMIDEFDAKVSSSARTFSIETEFGTSRINTSELGVINCSCSDVEPYIKCYCFKENLTETLFKCKQAYIDKIERLIEVHNNKIKILGDFKIKALELKV